MFMTRNFRFPLVVWAVETIDAWMTAVDLLDDGLLRHGVLGRRTGVRTARSAHFLARSSPRSRPRRPSVPPRSP